MNLCSCCCFCAKRFPNVKVVALMFIDILQNVNQKPIILLKLVNIHLNPPETVRLQHQSSYNVYISVAQTFLSSVNTAFAATTAKSIPLMDGKSRLA